MSPILIAASAAAAMIHFALGPDHVEELGMLGLGFYLAGALQAGWAGAAVLAWRSGAPSRRSLRRLGEVGIGLNAAIVGAWIFSRVVGLPAGEHPWTPEAVGLPDSITALLEIGIVAALVMGRARWHATRPASRPDALAPGPVRERPSLIGAAPMLAVILIATVTALGTPHAHADGAAHDADAHAGMPAGEMTGHTH